MTRTALALAAVLAAAGLGSCGDDPPARPPEQLPTGLAVLSAQADRWAQRAEPLLNRGWAVRLAFRQRLYARVQTLRSFINEATASAAGGETPPERLIERGRALIDDAKPFDDALALLELVTPNLDQLTGYERVIALNMQPLETRGEAPYRMRVADWGKQVAAGFSNLDLALQGILDKSGDVTVFKNIAEKGLADALATATKLSAEVNDAAHLAAAASDRQRQLHDRVKWAADVAARAGTALPAEAARALADAQKFVKEELDRGTDEVLERIRNAQPDAAEKAKALAGRVAPVIEDLTKAFLPVGRAAGVPDPGVPK